ncbi:hypothetical protein [Tunturiibacter gelidiferens]|uniref:hypothetical protein n=1 Tax=Tunturiibacter gelidiferens TaxID=3069689 RepID=UPI003D9B45FD
MCGWFGVNAAQKFGPQNRVVVTLTNDVNGAVNSGYSVHNSQMSVNPEIGQTNDLVMLLFADEMSEILMTIVADGHRASVVVKACRAGAISRWIKALLSLIGALLLFIGAYYK